VVSFWLSAIYKKDKHRIEITDEDKDVCLQKTEAGSRFVLKRLGTFNDQY